MTKKNNHHEKPSNVVKMNYDIYNSELDELHKHLVTYAFQNFQDVILETADLPDYDPSQEPTEIEQTYLNGITLWIILNVPIIDDVRTIFDMFLQLEKDHIKRTRTKNIFSTWGNASPALYEVIATDESDNTGFATLRNVKTQEEFITPIKEHSFVVGSAIIGTLVPYVGYHHFFLSMIEVYEHGKQKIIDLYRGFLVEGKELKSDFPEFLSLILKLEQKFNWNNKNEADVAALFSSRIKEKDVPEEINVLAVFIWYEYCQKKRPAIKSIPAQAAALEYLLHRYILNDKTITQKELAEEYGTSPGAISNNYRNILDSLEEDLILKELEKDNELYEVDEFAEDTISLPGDSTRKQAQSLIYDAQVVQGKEREDLIKQALEIHPNSADAYLLLAESARDYSEFSRLLLQAIQAGENDLDMVLMNEEDVDLWGIPEVHPYLKALEIYAVSQFQMGNLEEALEYAETLLSLNPTDQQRIRYIILPIYIELEELETAQAVMRAYEDKNTNFLFNKILVEFLTHGMTLATRRYIKEANKYNPYVREFLKGTRSMDDVKEIRSEYTDEFEALEYAELHLDLWDSHPDLLSKL